jgi:hypothetical protein
VTSAEGSPAPVVDVTTMGMEEIEENIASVAKGRTRGQGKLWTDQEIEELFLGSDNPTVRDLFLWTKTESNGGQFQSTSPKVSAAFNFYVRVRHQSGPEKSNAAFQYVDGQDRLKLYLNWSAYDVPEDAMPAYRDDLAALFGDAIDVSVPEPSVPLVALQDKLNEFEALFLRFRDAIAPAAGE